jgi:uncharacterized DUF497 family protein
MTIEYNELFEWDTDKEDKNIAKHGVGFKEASTVFDDPDSKWDPDPLHSEDEERFYILGVSDKTRLLLVCYCEVVNDKIRIISARGTTENEKSKYMR